MTALCPPCGRRLAAWAGAAGAALLLAACATAPPPPAPPPPEAPARWEPVPAAGADVQLAEFVRTQYQRASEAEAAGRLAEAALAWEVLTLTMPEDAGAAARLSDVRRRIDEGVRARLPRAAAAQRRGELEQAAQLYLEVMALSPDHDAAADALRAIERERNKRSFVGKFSRQVLGRRAAADGEMRMPDAAPPSGRSPVEHATLLARQGDVDGAIAMLTEGGERPTEAAGLALLADLYVQRAQGLQARDPTAARTWVEAALAIDRRHAAALALARKLPKPRAAAPAPAGRASAPPAQR